MGPNQDGICAAGTRAGAIGHSIELLIAGRVLQGISFGLFPLAISVLRKELPGSRIHHGMAVAASALGCGSGFALVATGLLTQHGADYRRIFWLTAVAAAVMLALSAKSLPHRAGLGGRIDYIGAVLLGSGLVLLLLPISQGHEWGWNSFPVIILFIAAAVVLAGFGLFEARTKQPLIALSLLSQRSVLATNLASAFVGYAMFSLFLGATYFVQAPKDLVGYGFGASVLRTSIVYMLPGALVAVVLGPIAGRFVGKYGPRLVLLAASVLGVAALAGLTLLHENSTVFIVALVAGNAAVAVAYAAMPALLMMYVEPKDTGVANSVNSVMRTIGGAIGSAIVITILASLTQSYPTPAGPVSIPTEGAYQTVFILGGVAFGLAALLAAFGAKVTKGAHPL